MLDVLDLKILREFCKLKINEESSTWEIMKKIFNEGKNENNVLVKRRIEYMSKLGLFKINGEKIRTYTLIDSNVSYKNFTFPNGNKKGIAILINSKWSIYEV